MIVPACECSHLANPDHLETDGRVGRCHHVERSHAGEQLLERACGCSRYEADLDELEVQGDEDLDD